MESCLWGWGQGTGQQEGRSFFEIKSFLREFPGGAVVKNPPANAGDTGSIPGPGRSHMLRSNEARAPQLLSLCFRATTTEPVCHNY